MRPSNCSLCDNISEKNFPLGHGPKTQSLQDLDATVSTRRTSRPVRKLTRRNLKIVRDDGLIIFLAIHRMQTLESSEDDLYKGRRSFQGGIWRGVIGILIVYIGLSDRTRSQKCLALDSLTYNFTQTKVYSSVNSLPSLPVSEDASYYLPEETYGNKNFKEKFSP